MESGKPEVGKGEVETQRNRDGGKDRKSWGGKISIIAVIPPVFFPFPLSIYPST
jgi:hypothetical protein